MTTVTEEEATIDFDSLLDRVEAGEEFLILRNGQSIAQLLADTAPNDGRDATRPAS